MVIYKKSKTYIIYTAVLIVIHILFTPGSASSVQLRWDPNAETDVAGYMVYYNVEPSPLEGTIPLNVNNQTTAIISGLDSDKSYRFAVTAYNSAGLESSYSNIVSLPEQLPPTVEIVSPADAASVSGIVTISTSARDNVGITRVEFYVNGTLMAARNLSPYSLNWDTIGVEVGNYTLMAKAFDNAGNSAQSTAVTVRVGNPVPVHSDLTVADALLALQISSGKITATPEQMARLDVSPVISGQSAPDGRISSGDAIAILSNVVGMLAF